MIHPEALWAIHVTCPRDGTPVEPQALPNPDHPQAIAVDTRAVVRCPECAATYIIEVVLRAATMPGQRGLRRAG